MGLSKWVKDLEELAEAKREQKAATEAATEKREAAMEAARVMEAFESFGGRCRRIVTIEAAPDAEFIGRSTALVPQHDGFAKEVVGMAWVANELLARLGETDSSTASGVLAEFGLPVPKPPSEAQLVKIQHAVKEMAERSEQLMHAWIFDPAGREWEASRVAQAAERLLLKTTGR